MFVRRIFAQLPRCNRAYAAAAHNVNSFTLEQQHINEAVKRQPILGSMSMDLWHRSHETFVNHGIATNNFLQIVVSNPALLSKHPQKIIATMEVWRSLQFGEKLLHLLITKYPELLNVPDEFIRSHFSYLKTFGGTSKNVWKLLMNCPNLMEQSEKKIEEKIEYLTQTMRIEMPEIVKSEAFSKTLEDIQYRHVFLQRLGMFSPRPLKADVNQPSKNHRLYKITDTSDKTFATKVCHVSLIEYEAFKELYARELERERRNSEAEMDELSSDEDDQ